MILYGRAPVPQTVLWSAEENVRPWTIAPCPHAGGSLAMHAPDRRGEGRPVFGSAHPQRQRRAMALAVCGVCGASLKGRDKVSLSAERATHVEGIGVVPVVVEPLCCRPCAALSAQHCPHLRRQIAAGELVVRKVVQFTVVAQALTGAATVEFTGERRPGTIGHLKAALTKWSQRDLDWLMHKRSAV